MVGNPLLVVGLGTSGNGRGFVVRGDDDRVDLAGRLLATTSGGPALLLGKVGDNPNGVEEIADGDGACEKEEVQEQAVDTGWLALASTRGMWMEITYSCGSKMLASGSTMETVPLNAGSVKKAF